MSVFDRYEAMSFDCYGTLIDWETGILAHMRPWADAAGLEADDDGLLQVFGRHENRIQQAAPGTLYAEVLARSFEAAAEELGAELSEDAARAFGASVPDWPAFPDSVEALARLAGRYRLFILSNVHEAGIAGSVARLGPVFEGVFTAETIGSYKPDLRNFGFLLARVGEAGIRQDKLLHVGQSLMHDMATAEAKGLDNCWIDRRHAKKGVAGATPALGRMPKILHRFESMAGFADAAT